MDIRDKKLERNYFHCYASGAYALILSEVDGKRKLPYQLYCGKKTL